MALMGRLIDVGMHDVAHTADTFHVYTEIRLVHGQYMIVKDDFEGPNRGRIEVEMDPMRTTTDFWSRSWRYTGATRDRVRSEIVAAMAQLGGGAARIQRGPWLTHMIGNRYSRTRLTIPNLAQLQRSVHPQPQAPGHGHGHGQGHGAATLASFEYGPAELDDHFDGTDPILYEDVPLDKALYLATNLPRSGRIKQLWAFEGSIKRLLESGQLVSPITRKPFTRADIKRLQLTDEDVPLAKRVVDVEDMPLRKRMKHAKR